VVARAEDGWPALIRAGGLHYLAGWADPPTLFGIIGNLCAEAGIATTDLPEGLRQRDSATHRFWFNYAAHDVTHAGRTIPAAGVLWEPLR
jgi:beta-galactosidase